MSRLTVVPILLALVAGTALAQSAADAPPTRPGDFRATLYDKAGGELFWQRSTDDRGAVRGYEITKNGRSLGIRDALSYYDPTLEPGVPYTFTVVAIDNAGQRSAVATTTLGGGTTSPADDAPPAPAALRAEVYSKRSAELFWQREPAELRLRYEIRRDGDVAGATNGISYYTNALAAGTGYAFEVVAIDPDGNRSRPSRVTVRTAGGAQPTLPAPANLRASVYSRTAAELFWDRATTVGLRYEIRRDGDVAGTTDGTSFFDDALAGGTRYAYEVVALDGGRRSAASTLTVTTRGGGAEPPPGVEPAESAAPRIVSVDRETGESRRDGVFPTSTFGRQNSVTEDGRFIFHEIDNGIFRYRLADGDIDRVADGDQRRRWFLEDVSDDGDTVLLGGENDLVARAADGFVQRTYTFALSPSTRISGETLSGDGSTIAFVTAELDSRAFIHDVGSRTLIEVSRETAPSPNPEDNARDWEISSVAAISDDGRTIVFAGRAPGSTYFVHDRDGNSTRLVPYFRGLLECSSCPPENAGPAPLLSADGRRLVYSSVPDERREVRDPPSDLYVLDLDGGTSERIADSSGAGGLSGDDALSLLAWRKGSTQTLVPLDGGERVTLTRAGYGRCPVRVCLFGDGDSDELTPKLAADGSSVVFVERVLDDEAGAAAPINRLRAYDVAAGRFETVLDGADPRSVEPVSVQRDFDVSGDGSVIAVESSIRPSADAEPRSVVLAIER